MKKLYVKENKTKTLVINTRATDRGDWYLKQWQHFYGELFCNADIVN